MTRLEQAKARLRTVWARRGFAAEQFILEYGDDRMTDLYIENPDTPISHLVNRGCGGVLSALKSPRTAKRRPEVPDMAIEPGPTTWELLESYERTNPEGVAWALRVIAGETPGWNYERKESIRRFKLIVARGAA